MPYPGEHAARQKKPSLFVEDSFIRRTEGMPEGVTLVMARLKSEDRLAVQSVRFAATLWTPGKAKKWLEAEDYRIGSFEEAITKGKYDHINFVPPKGVAANAAKGLEYRRKASPSNRGGLTNEEASQANIGSGVQRAVNLKNRDKVSPDTIGRMVSFFARHKKNSKIDAKNKSTPWKDKGYVAWLLWGGDAGESWASKVKGQMEAAKAKTKKSWSVAVPISKLAEDKMLAFGWASVIADEKGNAVVDHQADRISVPELEKAAYDYVQSSRQSTEMHDRLGVAELVESCMITPEKREAMGMTEGITGWWVGFRVVDPEVWQKVKDGIYNEFSIGGSAKRKAR